MSTPGRDELRPVRIPFGDITLDQYDAVITYLREQRAYHQFVDGQAVVPAKHVEQVHALIDRHMPRTALFPLSDGAPGGVPFIPGAIGRRRPRRGSGISDDDAALVFRPAPIWTRPVRYVVDEVAGLTVAFAAVAAVVLAFGDDHVDHTVMVAISLAVWLALFVWPNARWGRTVGGWATGTRLVRFDTLDAPGWSRSLVRSIVPQVPSVAAAYLFTLDLGRRADVWIWSVAVVAVWAVYASLITEPDRRGWHDRLARTIVVDHRPRALDGGR